MAIRGSLKDIILPDLLQLPNVSRRTGTLTVQNKKDIVTIYFKNGEVTHAVFNDMVGEEAVFSLLDWTEGEFEFVSGDIPKEKTVKMRLQNILIEAAKRHDEKVSQTAKIPDLKKQTLGTLVERFVIRASPFITFVFLADSKGKELLFKSKKPKARTNIPEIDILVDSALKMEKKSQRGKPAQIVIQDNEGYLAYNRAAKDVGLIVAATKEINLGQLFLILKRATDKINEVL